MHNTPINKGNYSMETKEREARFEACRAKGWENQYKKYRSEWAEFAEKQFVSEYPLLVDIELSSLCNLHCPMCYTITDEFKGRVKTRLMEFSLFCKIIDEIAEKVPAIRLSLRGEATLHPQFVECIKYAKNKGIGEVSFLTNGVKLTEDFFIEIAEAGADWITVSVDGVGKKYENIRRPLKFEETYRKLKRINEIKEARKWVRPVIKVQSIWPAIRDDPSEFYNTFAPITDYVAFNPLITYNQHGIMHEYEDGFSCPQPYQRLVVGSDGRVLLCSNDENGLMILGDLNNSTVYEVWHGDKMEYIRELHKNGRFMECMVCRECYVPRKTDDTEMAQVNGRNIIIKNYK